MSDARYWAADLGLSVRLLNALFRRGVESPSAAAAMPDFEILKTANVGRVTLAEWRRHFPRPGSPSSPTWPYVLAFAKRMEAKLEKNRHKGDREGWINDDAAALLKRLREEVDELEHALRPARQHGIVSDSGISEARANEAADVANFAMMIADVCGGVKP